MQHYDYIVVGSGPSGCVTASRLVADFGKSVLLLEAGPANTHPMLKIPAGFIKMLAGSRYLTFQQTTPQPQLDGRVHQIPQGRVLGGGSSVNAMVYMRGRPADYARWNAAIAGAADAPGWGWEDMLPHYVKQESNQLFAGPAHGIAGPVSVTYPSNPCTMSRVFVQTLQAMGHGFCADFNAGTQSGAGFMQTTIRNGRRCGAVEAFLRPLDKSLPLTVATNTTVKRIKITNGTATGVVIDRKGVEETIYANAEVIVTAGAFGTPKLLQLSGIGPAAQLQSKGVEVVLDLPGVGENLMDHHEVPIVAATTGHYGYYGEDRGVRMIRNGLHYLLSGRGPVASNGCEACAFINPLHPDDDPATQLYCVPTVYLDRDVTGIPATDGVTLNSCLLQPRARGSVQLRSANVLDMPLVHSNYLGHQQDILHQIAGLRFAREVLAASPMRQYIREELFPGTSVTSDKALLDHCKRTVKTNYHPCGTCKMGSDNDPMAVLTPKLQVRGIAQLRVFDVSMMPHIISGNTNAPAMAVADRAVDILMQSS